MKVYRIKNIISIFAFFVFLAFLSYKYYENYQNRIYFDFFYMNNKLDNDVTDDIDVYFNGKTYEDNGILNPYYTYQNINIGNILESKDGEIKQKLIDLLNEFAVKDIKRLYKSEWEEYYKLLDKTKIIGDSMVNHLHNYNMIEHKYYVAFPGQNLNYFIDNIDEYVGLYTKNIIFWTGYNIAFFKDADEYVNTYQQLYDKVKAINKNTKVYICSLMPATKEAINRDLKGDYIHNLYKGLEFDLALKKHFANNYIDIKFLAKPDYYGTDGIHFKVDLYNMLVQYLAYYINLEY